MPRPASGLHGTRRGLEQNLSTLPADTRDCRTGVFWGPRECKYSLKADFRAMEWRATVLVHPSCHNRAPWARWLIATQTYCSRLWRLGGLRSRPWQLQRQVRVHLLVCKHPSSVSGRAGGEGTLQNLTALTRILRAPLRHLPRAPPPNAGPLRVRIPTIKFWEDTILQSVVLTTVVGTGVPLSPGSSVARAHPQVLSAIPVITPLSCHS